ncbi:hypothetical protein OZX68_03430 [Streptococcaceae bacterium ESL0729]|nr:hypothetical protein OZX68_03430 [Streptococcaceae bacterium ESL0729]
MIYLTKDDGLEGKANLTEEQIDKWFVAASHQLMEFYTHQENKYETLFLTLNEKPSLLDMFNFAVMWNELADYEGCSIRVYGLADEKILGNNKVIQYRYE